MVGCRPLDFSQGKLYGKEQTLCYLNRPRATGIIS
ncbi:hypothetical protein MTY_0274 [Moorella thermoacetica Y72]|uniref:Uncharacterized protein n=1 Tax=Moorella thermoacetica Y72 TaxID=1325331 RepID=A0A0S6U7G3_NEOTH|nr:hypothetical protein MTY_0274 [Moorella thermoacetica Y72]